MIINLNNKRMHRFIVFTGLIIYCVNIMSVEIVSAWNLLLLRDDVQYQKVHDPYRFSFDPFPLSRDLSKQPSSGLIDETFVLTIPQGCVCSPIGLVLTDGKYTVQELLVQYYSLEQHLSIIDKAVHGQRKKISGRVAVIASSDFNAYAHWIRDVLGRLALLEIAGVEYDWLYVPMTHPWMKEMLELWGVDLNKVIQPYGEYHYIQADELIVPSLIAYRIPLSDQNFSKHVPLSNYYTPWVIDYVRQKFLPLIDNLADKNLLSKKVYISRKDSNHRKIINEDAVFELFEQKGFRRYELSKMPFLQQVALFKNAEIIVAPHGSNFANLLFASPGVTVIEIFQHRDDSTEFYLSQMVGAYYYCIKTTDFLDGSNGFRSSVVPVNIIQTFIDEHSWLFQ